MGGDEKKILCDVNGRDGCGGVESWIMERAGGGGVV